MNIASVAYGVNYSEQTAVTRVDTVLLRTRQLLCSRKMNCTSAAHVGVHTLRSWQSWHHHPESGIRSPLPVVRGRPEWSGKKDCVSCVNTKQNPHQLLISWVTIMSRDTVSCHTLRIQGKAAVINLKCTKIGWHEWRLSEVKPGPCFLTWNWPLIGPEWSHDPNTGLWLAPYYWELVTAQSAGHVLLILSMVGSFQFSFWLNIWSFYGDERSQIFGYLVTTDRRIYSYSVDIGYHYGYFCYVGRLAIHYSSLSL